VSCLRSSAQSRAAPVARTAPVAQTAPCVRLNWGCGSHVAGGWINSDVKSGPGVDLVADIRKGLPLVSENLDYAVSVHALPEFAYPELQAVLEELRRVLKPGGVLRLALPDLRRGVDAYLRDDPDYFQIDPEEVKSQGGRFIVHMLWYGYSRSLFTVDFAEELLERSGFVDVRECAFKTTASDFEQIVELDNRPDESFFVEARRGPDRPGARAGQYDRRVAAEASLQIVEIVHSTPNDQLRGHFRVEQGDSTLEFVGWALGAHSPVVGIEILVEGEVVASTSPVIERPDIAEAFPDVEGAATCGFALAIEPNGKGRSRLELRATLQDGEHASLGELEVTTAQQRRKGFFRRSR
jgi:predicted SAM-dependent methyltransferase